MTITGAIKNLSWSLPAVLGAGLWVPTEWLRRSLGYDDAGEVWYIVTYPLMVLSCFLLARWYPGEPWTIGGLMVGASYLAALIFIPGTGQLLPFEVLIMALLLCPLAWAGKLGTWFWSRFRHVDSSS